MLAISKASLFPQQTSLSHSNICLYNVIFFRRIPFLIKKFSTQTISPFTFQKEEGKEEGENTTVTVPQAQPIANNTSTLLL
jgi:hypothetical protein